MSHQAVHDGWMAFQSRGNALECFFFAFSYSARSNDIWYDIWWLWSVVFFCHGWFHVCRREVIAIGPEKSCHWKTWLKWLLVHDESRIELRNLQISKKVRKIKSFFVIRAALWAEMLGCCLEYCWVFTLHLYISLMRNIFLIPDDAVDRRKLVFYHFTILQ